RRERPWITDKTTSPDLAYSMMLRATSETAVAIITRSAPSNPMYLARLRAAIRASTMSISDTMGMTRTPGLGSLRFILQQRQRFLQVEGSRHIAKFQAQLDHGESHLRLNAHNYGPRSAEPHHLRQVADCS